MGDVADPQVSHTAVCDRRARTPSGARRRVACPVSDSMSCRRRAKQHGSENRADKPGCAAASHVHGRSRPIRISGRRESGIAACPALVEFDQRCIHMQILDHRTPLEVEPLSTHLVRPVRWPLLLIGQPTVQHRREQVWPDVVQNLPFRVGRPRLPARGPREAPVAGPRRPARREQWCRLAWPRRGRVAPVG